MGYAKTKKEVLALAERILAEKGRSITVSNGWWESFNRGTQLLHFELQKIWLTHALSQAIL